MEVLFGGNFQAELVKAKSLTAISETVVIPPPLTIILKSVHVNLDLFFYLVNLQLNNEDFFVYFCVTHCK